MAVLSPVVHFDYNRYLPFGVITNIYQVLGAELTRPMRLIKIQNTCDAGMWISFDRIVDNDYIPAGGFALYDFTANHVQPVFTLKSHTQVYVRYESAPSKGGVYLTAVYGRGDV